MDYKCFLLEPLNKQKMSLRRYNGETKCPIHGYHDAMLFKEIVENNPYSNRIETTENHLEGYPTKCDCGYEFLNTDTWQIFNESLWLRREIEEEFTLRNAPIGAMWYSDWMKDFYFGPDGKCLSVRTPGGVWMIDSRASNCTMPNDDVHRCWIRHGVPPDITVDKNGNTCKAGGGSISQPNYHGFLRNGFLVNA